MTNTNQTLLSRESGDSLVQQIVRTVQTRIDDRLMRSGARMPSIREFAATHGVSRFTVVRGFMSGSARRSAKPARPTRPGVRQARRNRSTSSG